MDETSSSEDQGDSESLVHSSTTGQQSLPWIGGSSQYDASGSSSSQASVLYRQTSYSSHWDSNIGFYQDRPASAPVVTHTPVRLITDDLPVFTSLCSFTDTHGRTRNIQCGGDYDTFYDSIQSDASKRCVLNQVKLYKRRWYLLFVFFWLAFIQGALVDVYQVIAQSAEAAFHWSDATVSLMQNWIYVTYIVGIFPFTWVMDAKGMRLAVVLSAFLTCAGAVCRCLSTSPPYVTWFANLGNVFVGLAAPVAFAGGPVLSSLWFPPHQRTTATGIATIAGFLGPSLSFVLGPNIVDVPETVNGSYSSPRDTNQDINYTNLSDIKQQILHLRYGECAVCVVLLLVCLIYFPSKPPQPPSLSAALDKVSFFDGIKLLFRKENCNFWLVCFVYMLSAGLYDVWSTLFDVNLKAYGIFENEAGLVAALAVFIGSVFAIITGILTDLLPINKKLLSVLLLSGCALSSFWLLLICQVITPLSNVQLYASTILQGICINGPIPLYYEMAIESNYPITETVTSGVLTLMYNVPPLIFLVVFWIPNVGTLWMNWCMYCCVVLTVPLMVLFQERFRRTRVDAYTEDMLH